MRVLIRVLRNYATEPLSARRAMRVIIAATTLAVIVGGVVIRIVDAESFPNIGVGMWWALQTVTTVGYGDVVPRTTAGRVIGSLIMVQSIAFVAIVTAWVTSSFVRRAQLERGSVHGAARLPAAEDPGVEALLRTIDARLLRIERALDLGTDRPPPTA
ncbi:two pore domain potassium channel family protein [Frankia sp. CNm7]|uniref:Two pore domain potassium channel family protein n=1 Tax=Frankia nepalensis TaxID=1836974 RepID=A0A937RU06_9ACTN|nr:potassium channel family protein [Frankia nepalensis]MBL7500073.1 two pore domain potassium channel family protein [Frankia nepalensis]MBL7509393.1 two pore domain potassium channel family protein [Frankia nepalensis]MBL7522846.1 two pore domain potassium channel family protein [Frankia nepalensis]MBL7631886.1 two pore domain potassium channel family protein [Frankia nepalensis]